MNKRKIKDFLSETRVRITSFVKNNKYITLGIALFAIIGVIVGFVVFADEPTADVKVLNVSIENESDVKTCSSKLCGFSEVTYTLEYKLENETGESVPVSIIADLSGIDDKIDAYWIDDSKVNNNYFSFIYDEGTKKTATIYINSNVVNKADSTSELVNTAKITLKIGNVISESNVSNINPKFTVKVGEKADKKKEVTKTDEVFAERAEMIPYLVPGYSYKEDSFKGKYVPFGIILGYPADALKGKYFADKQLFYIYSARDLDDINGTGYEFAYSFEEGAKDSNKRIGVFDRKTNIKIPTNIMPHYIYDSQELSVKDSGELIVLNNEEPGGVPFETGKLKFEVNNISRSFDNPILSMQTMQNGSENPTEIIAFGSYYGTVKAERKSEDGEDVIPVNISAVSKENIKNTIEMMNEYNSNVTETLVTTVEAADVKKSSSDSNDYNEEVTLAYGEEAKINIEYMYGIDSDESKKNLEINIPIPNDVGNPKYEIVSNSSNPSSVIQVVKNGEIQDTNTIKYYAYNSNGECAYLRDEDINNNSIICKVVYEDTNIAAGTRINISLRIKSNSIEEKVEDLMEVSIGEESNGNTSFKESKIKIKALAYKARTSMYFSTPRTIASDEVREYDITNKTYTVNGNDVSNATITIYPELIAPGLAFNSAAFGIQKSVRQFIRIELPNEVTYVPNEMYDNQPNTSVFTRWWNDNSMWCVEDHNECNDNYNNRFNNNKILFYEITSPQIGNYIEPIKIDVSFSTNISSSKNDLEIISKIHSEFNTSSDQFTYNPNKDHDTVTTGTIEYQIPNSILSSLTAPKSINKDKEFTVKATISNRTESTLSNSFLKIDLPAPEGYSGNVEYDFGDDAACLSSTSNEWSPDNCEVNPTSVKYNINDLAPSDTFEKIITVSPSENMSGDSYRFISSVSSESDLSVPSRIVEVSVLAPSISGVVWQDFNKDGVMDDSEKKIDGVKLYLYKVTMDEKQEEIESIDSNPTDETTSKNGTYRFSKVLENEAYIIVPEFDENKYGLTIHHGDVSDIRYMSSFKLYDDEIINDDGDDPEEASIGEDEINDENEAEDEGEDEEPEEPKKSSPKIRSDVIYVTSNKKNVQNINLGLTLKEVFKVKIDKYVTSATVTNSLGISNNNYFENAKNAKLDVKNIDSLSIKVIFTIKVKNIGYHPGLVLKIQDIIPDGMVFNEQYAENKGWEKSSVSDNIINYVGIIDDPLSENEEKFITVAFDLVNKTAGTYSNEALIDDNDLLLYYGEETVTEGEK